MVPPGIGQYRTASAWSAGSRPLLKDRDRESPARRGRTGTLSWKQVDTLFEGVLQFNSVSICFSDLKVLRHRLLRAEGERVRRETAGPPVIGKEGQVRPCRCRVIGLPSFNTGRRFFCWEWLK